MLGAIAGDIIGSVYEKRNIKRKDFSPLIHPRARFTDDTVCTVAIADALLCPRSPVESLQYWGQRYEHVGGWGQRFAFWLVDDDPKPYGSWGNGGAMRVSPAAFLAGSLDEALTHAQAVTEITHNHPEGLRGALATAASIWLALDGQSADIIRDQVETRFGYDLSPSVDEIRPTYRHSEAAAQTVPQALVCALAATSHEDAIRNAVSIGGDSDTIACIAGAVAEARFGLAPDIAQLVWDFLPEDMRAVMLELYRHGHPARQLPNGLLLSRDTVRDHAADSDA